MAPGSTDRSQPLEGAGQQGARDATGPEWGHRWGGQSSHGLFPFPSAVTSGLEAVRPCVSPGSERQQCSMSSALGLSDPSQSGHRARLGLSREAPHGACCPRPPHHCRIPPPHRSTSASSSRSPGSSPRSAPTATRSTGTQVPSSRSPAGQRGLRVSSPMAWASPASLPSGRPEPTQPCSPRAQPGWQGDLLMENLRDGSLCRGPAWPWTGSQGCGD